MEFHFHLLEANKILNPFSAVLSNLFASNLLISKYPGQSLPVTSSFDSIREFAFTVSVDHFV